jgi:hypothetical protein
LGKSAVGKKDNADSLFHVAHTGAARKARFADGFRGFNVLTVYAALCVVREDFLITFIIKGEVR